PRADTMTSFAHAIPGPTPVSSGRAWPRWSASLLALIVTGAGIAVGALRWTGESPYGSDNDEYRLVARSLVNGAGPVSAGEGTKYPVGYPLVLAACDALHLPVDGSALGLNALLVFVIAALV